MSAQVFNHSNYKSCPLKKRPIVFVAEEQETVLKQLKESTMHHEEEQPQDLSLKRKASQDFEDYSLPAKRDYVLDLCVSARSHIRRASEESYQEQRDQAYRAASPASSHGPTDLSSSVMLSPKAEFDSSMNYQPATDIHLRGLTPATSGYTTNPYHSAFVMAAGCNPMTALWNTYQSVNNTNISAIYPSPASSIASPSSAYTNSYSGTQMTSQMMMMTPPSSPGSDASSSSEPEDLSVRNDIPLPALFHLFDEAPTSASPAYSSSSSCYGSASSFTCGASAMTSVANNVAKNYRFKCDKCNKMYSTSMGLSKHQQFHCPAAECNQEKKQHSCQDCGKLYTTIGALKMHIRTHTLPCKCPICGKAFSRPWLLQGHIRTHTGEKPFQCSDCPRSFADRSNLRAHQQTHVEIKKYACKACHKSFSRMSLLNKHSSSNCTITIA